MTRLVLLILVTLCLGRVNAQVPVHFEENRGQVAPGVELLARGLGYSLTLSGAEATLALPGGNPLRLTFLGADAGARVCGDAPMPGTANYLRGQDPDQWIREVPVFARARVEGLHPGVDLVYYGSDGRLEFDLEVARGVDPAGIELQLQGACSIELTDEGAAGIELEGGVVSLLPPRVYQDGATGRREIPSSYMLAGDDRLRFELGAYDPDLELVIDPVLAVASYFGGTDNDGVLGLATDATGNCYACGYTRAPGIPLQSPLRGWGGGVEDAFVAKLDPTGASLLYSTYLGGMFGDSADRIVAGTDGSAYVIGYTTSPDFPIAAALQPSLGGGADCFVARISPTGSSLVYSTFLGGSGSDYPRDIDLDALGQAHVTGTTQSTNFPLVNPAQPAFGGYADTFVCKLSASGSALLYSTFLGGSDFESVLYGRGGIAVDPAGNAFVVGDTRSVDFPVLGPLQGSLAGPDDAFVARFDPGGAIVFSTYLGGISNDQATDVDVDSAGNAWLCGWTNSPDFPQVAPLLPPGLGSGDGFVVGMAADGSSLLFSSLLGGSSGEEARAIALDPWDNIHVSGPTSSPDFPLARPFQPVFGGGAPSPVDAFVAKISAGGANLLWSSYLGGAGQDWSPCIAVDSAARVWVGGITTGAFPQVSPVQPGYGGGPGDGFLARIDPVLLLRGIASPAVMVRGEAGVVVGIDVENAGVNSVQIDPLLLRFRDMMRADVAGGYTVTPSPGNPTVIAPGVTETLFFTLEVAPTAQLGATTLDASVTGTDLVTFQVYVDVEADMRGAWDVVGAVPFVRAVDTVPTTVLQGSIGNAVMVSVENFGVHALNVGSLALSFGGSVDRTAEYTVTPAPGNPTMIAGGATELFSLTVDVSPAASLELITLDATFSGTDAVTGAAVVDMGADVIDTWTVVGGEVFARTVDAAPTSVLQGSAGHAVTIAVENAGINTLNVGVVMLSFLGSVDRTGEYTVTPAPGNPTVIAGGATELFALTVDVSPSASLELITIDTIVNGTDAVTGAAVMDIGADIIDQWTVVGGQAFTRVVDAGPTIVLQGSSGHAVTVTVENTGINPINVGGITLSFTGSVDRTAEYTVTPAPGNPTAIPGGATELFAFTVDVSPAASAELITLDADFTGTDAVTGAPRSDVGADVTDQWTVVGGEALVRVVDAADDTVLTDTTGHAVTVSVENLGINPVTVGVVTLTFTGAADRSGEYTVTADPGNPTSIAGGATELFAFTVDVSPGATLEVITIDAGFTGSDAATGAPRDDPDADIADAWTVIGCIAAACGDCNGDGQLSILDSLTAAQAAAAVITLTREAFANCNVTGVVEPMPGAVVDVLDALTLAQVAAGLPVAMTCC